MNTSRCIYCGSEIPAGARFCPGCAQPVEQPQPQYQQAPPPQQQQSYGPPQMPYQQAQAPQMPYQQGPVNYNTPHMAPPPPKKSKGGLIALIIILALALLGGGGWALYKYVIKPALEKKTTTTYSSSDDDEDNIESFSTYDGDEDNSFFGKKREEIDKNRRDIPQGLDNKNRYNEPFGMTDEEAAQMRRNGRDIPQGLPKRNATTKKKKDKFKGWTKEEKARWRKMKENNVPFGMTDEEAAEMRRRSR